MACCVTVDGTRLTIDPGVYFYRYESPSWLLCDWDAVRADLLEAVETPDTAVEQRVLDYVRTCGSPTSDPVEVLRTGWQVYSYLFRDEHLSDPTLAEVTAAQLAMLRECGTLMALNRVELDGHISIVGPAWMFPATARVVSDLSEAQAEQLDGGMWSPASGCATGCCRASSVSTSTTARPSCSNTLPRRSPARQTCSGTWPAMAFPSRRSSRRPPLARRNDTTDIRDGLYALGKAASGRAQGAEVAPFGLCHSEFHPTSLHITDHGWRLLDWARAFTGPGLLDLASWQGTTEPPDLDLLDELVDAYLAAGGPAEATTHRGGLPARQWAMGWHRLWVID